MPLTYVCVTKRSTMEKFVQKTFPHGVHFHDNKELSKDMPLERMPAPSDVFISVSQHIGAPSSPVVAVGDKVVKGQLIAEANGGLGSKVYSSVCGEVVAIVKKAGATGAVSDHIHIKTVESEECMTLADIDKNDAQSILQRIFEAGIVGMGGAGFPTNVKLKPSKPVDTLIINAAECEPYITCDYRLLLEKADQVIAGANYLAKACGLDNVVFGVEANKLDCAELLMQKGAKVTVLKKKYPQGAEKELIYAVNGRKVPCGGLPMDVGVIVQNVATAFAAYEAVELNKPLYERAMTVSGRGVNSPKNLTVANGTSYQDIFDFCGGLNEDALKLISGGPMMGFAFIDTSISTTKTTGSILALTKKETSLMQPSPCINCGRCARACPMNLMPMYIDFYTLAGDYDTAVKYGALNCFECGSCAFSCPAKRAIVQSVRLCKKKLKERK